MAKQTLNVNLKAREFVCLLGFNVRAAIFHLYSDDEHDNDDEMKNGWDTGTMGSTNFDCHWKLGEMVRVGQFPTPGEYHSRVLSRARNVASFLTRCTTMVCGFPYYSLTIPACNTPGVPYSITWGTHPSCSVGRAL